MQWINSMLAVLAGLGLRLAVPILITLLVVYILHKVDIHWQEEAAQTPPPVIVEKVRCWEAMNCPASKVDECPAPVSEKPCWQVRRLPNGYLREECLTCRVFLQAPIPLPIQP